MVTIIKYGKNNEWKTGKIVSFEKLTNEICIHGEHGVKLTIPRWEGNKAVEKFINDIRSIGGIKNLNGQLYDLNKGTHYVIEERNTTVPFDDLPEDKKEELLKIANKDPKFREFMNKKQE